MAFDTAYEAITEESQDQRWAFGTGFADPMAGISAALPAGADPAVLAAYCLMLGDDALIMSHRLQQWLARAPELEEETALANIALDLLGQARLLLSRAAQAAGRGQDEDDLAFARGPAQFRNVTLAEGQDADFGALIARLLVFSTWRLALLDRLRASRDPVLAAVAAKGVTEITYHRDYAAQWLLRLAGGTDYSRARVTAGLAAVAPDLPELFTPSAEEHALTAAGLAADPAATEPEVAAVLAAVLDRAALDRAVLDRAALDRAALPGPATGAGRVRGRAGQHTAALAEILDELQSVTRDFPGARW